MTGGELNDDIPRLVGAAADAVAHRGNHIQIIACAGAGKTETVAQRVASLVAEGVEPSKIVAFTFTEKAAAELKERIRSRVEAITNKEIADRLGNMYVGTIHGFCFQLLAKYDGRFESFDVLDQQQVGAFLHRMSHFLELKKFDGNGKLFRGLENFAKNVEVVENELLDAELMPEPFRSSLIKYYELLEEHRLLTFGQQIAYAVKLLERDELHEQISSDIDHLIVDEYQDVNPAQEKLIEYLSKPIGKADLVVVGDDDQAIYQWRGSKVENIVSFTDRYQDVSTFKLLENRRSRPQIVRVADKFARTIPNRLMKEMENSREAFGPAIDFCYDYDTEEQETNQLALTIKKLRSTGYPYSAMAVLVRTKSAYPAIMKALETHGIPVQPGGRTGLFGQADADFLGKIFAWMVDDTWSQGRFASEQVLVTLDLLKSQAQTLYQLSSSELLQFETILNSQKATIGGDSRKVSLIRNLYEITESLGIKQWSNDDALLNARLGTIARFFKLIADYESVQKRARYDEETGKQVSPSDQKVWYFRNLSILLNNFAQGAYDDFEGEEDLNADAIELITVHAAKGLEWPIVFLPSLTQKRFPSSQVGSPGVWFVPTDLFDTERYEGGDSDERRLFYVALTRARDWVSLSAHKKVKTQPVKTSNYLLEIESFHKEELNFPQLDSQLNQEVEEKDLQITYSEIADYLNCGYAYWLRNRLGFPPELVAEIGFGKAVHHLMRAIAEFSQKHNRSLSPVDVDRILATEFFLPFAGKTLAARFRENARKLVFQYVEEYHEELEKTWATERPFELALPGVIVSGRADVVISQDNENSLAIMDYKTGISSEDPSLQLQIYAEAGRREGLDVTGAYIHDLGTQERHSVDLGVEALESATAKVVSAANDIKERKFDPKPEVSKCARCDVRFLCKKAATAE